MKKEKLKNSLRKDIKKSLFFLLIIVLLTTSCGIKNFNKELFTKIVEKNNFIVADLSTDNNKKYLLAVGEHYQISYYELPNIDKCKKELKDRTKSYRNIKKNISKIKKANYEVYIIDNNDIYTVFYRISNNYIEISTTKKYKEDVIKLLEEMDLEL